MGGRRAARAAGAARARGVALIRGLSVGQSSPSLGVARLGVCPIRPWNGASAVKIARFGGGRFLGDLRSPLPVSLDFPRSGAAASVSSFPPFMLCMLLLVETVGHSLITTEDVTFF